jgi:hypothetical protein
MLAQTLALNEGVRAHASAADYCKIFADEMPSMYLLAFLLTADKDRAEECFVGGLEECVDRVNQIGVFTERARSWARLGVVKQAIRMITPAPKEGTEEFFVSVKRPVPSATNNPFAVIASLGAFERFVFVMSVLEGHSDEDCQDLLRCSRQKVLIAREVALRLVATANSGWERTQIGSCTWPALLH